MSMQYEDDRVEFAVFFDVPLNVTTDQSGEQVVNFDCKNSPPARPSLILSGRDGENIDVAVYRRSPRSDHHQTV